MAPAGLIRPTVFPPDSVNQIFRSGPAAKPYARLPSGRANVVITPLGVILPMAPLSGEPLVVDCVNHRLPSGPATIALSENSSSAPYRYSVMTPLGVTFAIALNRPDSTNQRLPSGPATISRGPLDGPLGIGNSVTAPAGVIRPILPTPASVNQMLPSGPAVMPSGEVHIPSADWVPA